MPLPAPRASGWVSFMADLPGIVQKTGTPASSASVRSASVAPADSTPAPAQMSGFFASSSSRAASRRSPAVGHCSVVFGER